MVLLFFLKSTSTLERLYVIVRAVALVVAITRVAIHNLNVPTEIRLLKTQAPIAGQHVGHIDNHVLCGIGAGAGERVLVESGPLRASQLDGDTGAQERLVVSDLGDIRRRSRVVVIRERVRNGAEDGHL